jgi:hypothetical protein
LIHKENTLRTQQEEEDYQNNKKKMDSAVLKEALDSRLMLAKSLKAGTKVLKNQSVRNLKFTSVDNTNATHVMAAAFSGFNAIKTSLKEE